MRLLAFLLLPLTGCVSIGYHQRAVKEARADECERFQRWFGEYQLGIIPAWSLDKWLSARMEKYRQSEKENR